MLNEEREKFKDWDRWLLKCPFDGTGHLLNIQTTSDNFP